ncbi:MAG: potassium channel family protein [Candidatus Sumerlaeota bacterium]
MAMNISVFGLGTFGAQAARALYRGGATVMVADMNDEEVNRIAQHVSHAVCVDVINQEALESAGLFECDAALVSLRHHFDTTVLLTHALVKKGIENIIVQVDSELESEAIRAVGATKVIFPERDVAESVSRDILLPSLADQIFLGGDAAIVEVDCPDAFVGKKLGELDLRRKEKIEVVAFKRENTPGPKADEFEAPPDPDKPIEEGVKLLIVGKIRDIQKFREAAGLES